MSDIDPRVPILANMAATIFNQKQTYLDNADARRYSVKQAFLLYREVVIKLDADDRMIEEDGQ